IWCWRTFSIEAGAWLPDPVDWAEFSYRLYYKITLDVVAASEGAPVTESNSSGRGNGSADPTFACPCCGARLALHGDNAAVRIELKAERLLPGTMIIDPHAHMISRTTDDYEAMARAGVVAVIEPAFWIGQPRTNLGSYVDYLSTIIGFERFRAGQFGI